MAKLQNVRLAAVQRPGWLQIYRFDALVRVRPDSLDRDDIAIDSPPEFRQLYGLAREDARHGESTIRTFESNEDRREPFQQWSVDLIQLRNGRSFG